MTKEHAYLGHFKDSENMDRGHNVNWIAGAIKHPGALSAKAKRADDSPMQYARSHQHASGTTGRQARLAVTLSKLRKG
jgi:hypothetical protein